MKTQGRILITMGAVLLIATAAVARTEAPPAGFRPNHEPPMGMGNRGPGFVPGLGFGPMEIEALKLSQAQVSKIQAINAKYQKDTESTRTQLDQRFKELAVLWTAKSPNKSAIKSKVAQIEGIQKKQHDGLIDRGFKAMAVLTAQQKAKLADLIKSTPGFGARFGRAMGQGSMGGGFRPRGDGPNMGPR